MPSGPDGSGAGTASQEESLERSPDPDVRGHHRGGEEQAKRHRHHGPRRRGGAGGPRPGKGGDAKSRTDQGSGGDQGREEGHR